MSQLERNTRYRCKFEINNFIHVIYSDDISDFTSGFWIDEHKNFTKGSDCKYWLPSSSILYISKEKVRVI